MVFHKLRKWKKFDPGGHKKCTFFRMMVHQVVHPQAQKVKLVIKELQVAQHHLMELVDHEKIKMEAVLLMTNLQVVLMAFLLDTPQEVKSV